MVPVADDPWRVMKSRHALDGPRPEKFKMDLSIRHSRPPGLQYGKGNFTVNSTPVWRTLAPVSNPFFRREFPAARSEFRAGSTRNLLPLLCATEEKVGEGSGQRLGLHFSTFGQMPVGVGRRPETASIRRAQLPQWRASQIHDVLAPACRMQSDFHTDKCFAHKAKSRVCFSGLPRGKPLIFPHRHQSMHQRRRPGWFGNIDTISPWDTLGFVNCPNSASILESFL
jgi:hypothetical protein